jgi:hypothetical protein
LENPDGTYYGGNATVNGARRGNANNIDLNRHYPLTTQAPPTNFSNFEPEARAVLQLVDTLEFTLSANTHGGAELLNYPYDYANVIHPDENWMLRVYRQWADTVHKIAPNILTDQNNGVVRGFVWYQILGSRMDYLVYHKGFREVTFEGSRTKLVPGAQLPQFWNYYYRPLLNYLEQNLYGINGTVASATTAAPLKAKVNILNQNSAQSVMYSKLPHGDFWRPIAAGTYDVEFSATGYQTHVERNVAVQWDRATVLNIRLTPIGTGLQAYQNLGDGDIRVLSRGEHSLEFIYRAGSGSAGATILDASGRRVKTLSHKQAVPGLTSLVWDGTDASGNKAPGGLYVFRAQGSGALAKSFVLSR